MKIAFFYNLAFGGAKRVVFDQVAYLRKNGHTVDVYTTDILHDNFDMEKVASETFRYECIGRKSRFSFLQQLLDDYLILFDVRRVHKKIAASIDKKKYDIVLVHPDRLTQAPYLLRFLKTKNAYYCQEPLRIVYEYGMRFQNSPSFVHSLYETLRRFLRKKIDRENVRSSFATIASCYHIRERMIEAYDVYPYVVYAGIDIHTFHPVNVKKEKKVFFVGSKDVPTDGYIYAQAAVNLIPQASRPKLVVVSWRKNNGERLSDEELCHMYASSLMTLCMSTFETFGLVPLESMACGTPVIAMNVSGHRETVNKKGGILVEYDPEEIKNAIDIFLDPEQSQKMGKEARAYIETDWAWEKRIKNLEQIFEKIASL